MADIKDKAREYIAEHSEYKEVFGQTFIAVDTLTAMVEFAEQETKGLKTQIEKMKCCGNCKYSAQETAYSIICNVGGVDKGAIENVEDCLVCDKWEIKEK